MFQIIFKIIPHSPTRPDFIQGAHLSPKWAANVPGHSNQCVFFMQEFMPKILFRSFAAY